MEHEEANGHMLMILEKELKFTNMSLLKIIEEYARLLLPNPEELEALDRERQEQLHLSRTLADKLRWEIRKEMSCERNAFRSYYTISCVYSFFGPVIVQQIKEEMKQRGWVIVEKPLHDALYGEPKWIVCAPGKQNKIPETLLRVCLRTQSQKQRQQHGEPSSFSGSLLEYILHLQAMRGKDIFIKEELERSIL